jgi:hypothetical protein
MEFRTVAAVRMTPSKEVASPTHEYFVSRFRPATAPDQLHRALTNSSPTAPSSASQPNTGTVPSPGITIPRKR